MTDEQRREKAYTQGRRARKAGRPARENPYKRLPSPVKFEGHDLVPDGRWHHWWSQGWKDGAE